MTDKGAALNERVWRLFERAGFQTSPSSHEPSEAEVHLPTGRRRTVDLLAVDETLGVRIVGWNKARRRLGDSLTVHIHDYAEIARVCHANRALFVITEMPISDDDRAYAGLNGISTWGESELRYFEVLADAIGHYARFEIINSLGIQTDEEKNIQHVLALRLHQPFSDSGAELFLFSMTPAKLLRLCAILRRAQGNAAAYQRVLQRQRLRSIARFVAQDNALLPPNIIVHFSEEVAVSSLELPKRDANGEPVKLADSRGCDLVVLKIPMQYASMEVIDGQHRLYGFVGAREDITKRFNLVVLGMAGLSIEKRRDVFIAINDKARRVDANLVAYLKYTEDEEKCRNSPELMAIKVVVELNKTSPFEGKIRLFDFGDQPLTLKGFSGYDLRGLLAPKGLLRKYVQNECMEYVAVMRSYFSLLKSLFEEEWDHPEIYIVFRNRGISAFLKLLRSMLKTYKCVPDREVQSECLKALKGNWTGGWETNKLGSSYVGSKGWSDFHRDMVAAIQRGIPDFQE